MSIDSGERGAVRRLLKAIYDAMDEAADGALRRFAPGGRVPTRAGGTGHTQGALTPEATRDLVAGMVVPPAALDPTTAAGDLLYRDPASVSTVHVGFVGDSLTADTPGGGDDPPDECAAALTGHGLTTTAHNQGHDGATSADWLPGAGSGYLTAAKSAFAGAGVRLVHLMLGANDAKDSVATSAATYRANIAAIVADLVGAGYIVALSKPTYFVPGSIAGDFSAAALTRLQSYRDELDWLANGVASVAGDAAAYNYFATHAGQLSDGLHPDAAGSEALGGLWAAALRPIVLGLALDRTLARLPIGATGEVLTVAGGLPSWAAAAGGTTETYGIVFTGGGDVALRGDGTIATKVL